MTNTLCTTCYYLGNNYYCTVFSGNFSGAKCFPFNFSKIFTVSVLFQFNNLIDRVCMRQRMVHKVLWSPHPLPLSTHLQPSVSPRHRLRHFYFWLSSCIYTSHSLFTSIQLLLWLTPGLCTSETTGKRLYDVTYCVVGKFGFSIQCHTTVWLLLILDFSHDSEQNIFSYVHILRFTVV